MTPEQQNAVMKKALTTIAAMADPDDMTVDDNGLTEWGCEIGDAIEMAYHNCITLAQLALGDVTSK